MQAMEEMKVAEIERFIETNELSMEVLPAHENPGLLGEDRGVHWSCKIFNPNLKDSPLRNKAFSPYFIVYFTMGEMHRVWKMGFACGRRCFVIGSPYTGPRHPFKTVYDQEMYENCSEPAKPTLAEVLDCLASDINGVQNYGPGGFEDWCADIGLETDSRKARQSYDAICEQGARLTEFLGLPQFEILLNNIERL